MKNLPQVFDADLPAWFAFLEQYGFVSSEISYILCQVRV